MHHRLVGRGAVGAAEHLHRMSTAQRAVDDHGNFGAPVLFTVSAVFVPEVTASDIVGVEGVPVALGGFSFTHVF